MSIIDNISDQLSSLQTPHKMLAVAILSAIGIGIGTAAYITHNQNDGYVSLITARSGDISSAITQLDANQIKYRITSNGDLLVVDNQIAQARNIMAKNGQLFSNKSGYDLINKDQNIFINQTQQQLLKSQVIEENLEQTLDQINGIMGSKVHVTLSNTSEFMRDTNKATASVMLEVDPNRRLTDAQVRSIANLVSASVPYLTPENVTITDQFARQLTSDDQDNYTMSVGQTRYKDQLESDMHANIAQAIAPLIGTDNMRVAVTADINFDKVQNTREEYLDKPHPVKSEQMVYDYDASQAQNQPNSGVPGALSNQPPGNTKFDSKDKASNSNGNSENEGNPSHKQISKNFEVGRSVTNTQYANTSLRKLDVVVLIDRKTLEEEFNYLYKPEPPVLPDAPIKPTEPKKPVMPDDIKDVKPEKLNEDQKKEADKYKADLAAYDSLSKQYTTDMATYTKEKAVYDKKVAVITKKYNADQVGIKKTALADFITTRTENIKKIAEGTAGIDLKRGDTITVVTDSFVNHKPLKHPEPVVKKDDGENLFGLDDHSRMLMNLGIALLILLGGVFIIRRKSSSKDTEEATTYEQEQNVQQILDSMNSDTSFSDHSQDEIAKTMTRDQLEQDYLNAEDVDLDTLIEIAKDNLGNKSAAALIVLSEWLDNKTELRDAVVAEIKDNNAITRITKLGDTPAAPAEETIDPDLDIDAILRENAAAFTND